MLSKNTLSTLALVFAGSQALANDLQTPPPVREASWGCQVLLCLANPAGWRSVSYCVPPVSRLLDHLKKGRAFPTCEEATAAGKVRLVTRQFPLCPDGFREPSDLGFGDPEFDGATDTLPTKTCYGRYLGKKLVTDADTGTSSYVDTYETNSLSSHGPQVAYEITSETGSLQRIFPLIQLRAGGR